MMHNIYNIYNIIYIYIYYLYIYYNTINTSVGSPEVLICPGRCNRQIGFLLRWGCVARKPNRQSGRLEHPFRRYRWYLWWSYCRQMSTQILPTHSCKINDGPFSEFWGQGWSRTWTNPAVKTITRVLKQLSSVKNLQVRKLYIWLQLKL